MAAKPHNPDDLNPWPELPDLLRAGVRGARRAPAPPDSLGRALDRARRLKRRRPWILRSPPLILTGAVAAALVLLVAFRLPFGPYIAGTKDDSSLPPGPDPAADRVAASAPPPLLLRGPTIPSHRPPADYLTVGHSRPDSELADWERVRGLRRLSTGLSAPDRDGLERYLRQLRPQAPADRLLVWRNDTRPLEQARVLTAEGELKLQGVAVDVLVEGPRARTVVDHVFHNPHGHAVEAAFEFPLTDGASPSFFTLFPGNKAPRSAGTITSPGEDGLRDAGRPAPAQTPAEAARRIDPGCWGDPRVARVVEIPRALPAPTDGSAPPPAGAGLAGPAPGTFRGRIGPIPANSHFRILFAYEETLPVRGGRLAYEFPLPTRPLYDLSVTLRADARLAAKAVVSPADARREVAGPQVVYRRSWKNVARPGTLAFSALCPDPSVQATSGRHHDLYYLLARLRPDVPGLPAAAPFARHAVFLLDTSAGENAARFDRCVKLMRSVLERDADIRQFNVLAFSTGAAWLEPAGWIANTREGRSKALARLDGLHLEGATDLSAALAALAKPPFAIAPKTPLHCFLLSDGKLTAGDTDLPALVARSRASCPWPTRWHCYQTGLGEENAELFDLLTSRGGGVYLCPSDKDIPAAAAAHRRPCLMVRQVRVESAGRARDLFVAGRRAAVYPGGELLVAARLTAPGPAQVVIEGAVGPLAVVQRFPVEVGPGGALAARGWGEVAVGSLLGTRDPRLEPMAVSFARHFSLATRLTSFALAEGEEESDPAVLAPTMGDLGRLANEYWGALRAQASPYHRRESLRGQVPGWVQNEGYRRDLRDLLDLVPESELVLEEPGLAGGLSHRQALPADFVAEARRARKGLAPYFDEADRRLRAGEVSGAARCLCSLLEEYPGDAAVARQVAGRLVAMGQAAVAARLLTGLVERAPADSEAHRLLAIALEDTGRVTLAALHYEAALAQLGERPGFAGVRDELAHLLRHALAGQPLSPRLHSQFAIRLRELGRPEPSELRVSATWNTPGANVELTVTGPEGKAEQAPEPEPGVVGVETGPRRVEFKTAEAGSYAVEVRLARAAAESPGGTLVSVQVVRDAGTPRERVETRRVLLRREGERKEVARVKP